VLITHDEEVANFARRIVTLRDGEVVSDRAPRNRHLMTR
jgi:putative ABC transport system ATP-binding protein